MSLIYDNENKRKQYKNLSIFKILSQFCLYYVYIDSGLDCYKCGHEDGDCNSDQYGEEVKCQMEDPENPNYGDSCYVGHSGS